MKHRWGSCPATTNPIESKVSLGGFRLLDGLSGSSHREENHVYFYTEVTVDSIREMVIDLREAAMEMQHTGLNLGIEPPPVHLHIHSDGGDLYAGLAGLDAINEIKERVPVHTHIEGAAASAATLLSCAGTHRTIGPNSFMLIHQLSSQFWGKYEESADWMENNKQLMETLTAFYVKHAELDDRQVKQILKKDLWFSAKKTRRLGLVDEIR